MASALQVLGLATPVACKSELAEMDFGAWEGQTWNDIGEPQLTQWTDDFWHHRAGGGESVDQFVKRVQHALTEALSLAGQPEPSTPGASAHVLWITHAGVIRAVRALLHQQDQFPLRANQWPTHAPEPGAWQVIELG
jgi:alpha-ribazole phosphatase